MTGVSAAGAARPFPWGHRAWGSHGAAELLAGRIAETRDRKAKPETRTWHLPFPNLLEGKVPLRRRGPAHTHRVDHPAPRSRAAVLPRPDRTGRCSRIRVRCPAFVRCPTAHGPPGFPFPVDTDTDIGMELPCCHVPGRRLREKPFGSPPGHDDFHPWRHRALPLRKPVPNHPWRPPAYFACSLPAFPATPEAPSLPACLAPSERPASPPGKEYPWRVPPNEHAPARSLGEPSQGVRKGPVQRFWFCLHDPFASLLVM